MLRCFSSSSQLIELHNKSWERKKNEIRESPARIQSDCEYLVRALIVMTNVLFLLRKPMMHSLKPQSGERRKNSWMEFRSNNFPAFCLILCRSSLSVSVTQFAARTTSIRPQRHRSSFIDSLTAKSLRLFASWIYDPRIYHWSKNWLIGRSSFERPSKVKLFVLNHRSASGVFVLQ